MNSSTALSNSISHKNITDVCLQGKKRAMFLNKGYIQTVSLHLRIGYDKKKISQPKLRAGFKKWHRVLTKISRLSVESKNNFLLTFSFEKGHVTFLTTR